MRSTECRSAAVGFGKIRALRDILYLEAPMDFCSSHMSTTMYTAPLSFSTIGRGKAVLSLLAQIKYYVYASTLKPYGILKLRDA